MKRYCFGLSAIVLAVALSAFSKPSSVLIEYKLLHDPITAGIVSQFSSTEWSVSGSFHGNRCDVLQNDIACTLSLLETWTSYYHVDAGTGDEAINNFHYAYNQSPKQDYLDIIEATSPANNGYDRVIQSITPMHWNGYTYVADYNLIHGVDYTWKNARD